MLQGLFYFFLGFPFFRKKYICNLSFLLTNQFYSLYQIVSIIFTNSIG